MDPVYKSLQYTSATRKDRQKTADQILSDPEQFPLLLHHCFSQEKDISPRACWVLEFVCYRHLDWILPHLDYILIGIKNLKNESSIRPMAKICEMIAANYCKNEPKTVKNITPDHLFKIVTQCFDWLIYDHKVATKAYAMQSLFYLRNFQPWIEPQLYQILVEQRDLHSAAYKTRSKKILRKLAKPQ